MIGSLYGTSLSLLTDLYQLTMAQGYWKSGRHDDEAVFQLYFRKNPFGGGYAVACGLALAAEYIEAFRFTKDDLAYLKSLGLFEPGFLAYLKGLKLSLDVDAVPEGTAIFAPEPMMRAQGPLLQCQLLETALLNIMNFQTLIATKASRVAAAAGGAPVLEFGLRRAQGVDGGVSASRASYIGGCAATSNLLAGKLLGIPVRGTHAHSWVMAFGDELEAFQAYAEAMPGDCAFLVDTYDTLAGVRHAVEVGEWLKARGRRLAGVRLDSGDLADLSLKARRILDEAGFVDAVITASSDLDEHRIAELVEKGAPIGVWGVGTRLVTGGDQAALGGVYKLSAIKTLHGEWRRTRKISSEAGKSSYPGALQVRRFFKEGRPSHDAIFDLLGCPPYGESPYEDLLVPVFRNGERVCPSPDLAAIRARAKTQLALLPKELLRFKSPRVYPVSLELDLEEAAP
ncbi:MAG: nicotinate phosphoribosyltransferase [Elusimicrobia bacterium]|nr:nicotinate phosphoribosyltransferase [Elusimicrobiota bacterium]